MNTPSGTLIAYATGPGMVAEDGDGAHSSYAAALLDNLSRPGLRVEDLFKTVRLSVREATGDRQTPWETSSLTGEFCFKLPCGPGETAASPATTAAPTMKSSASVQDDGLAATLARFKAAQDEEAAAARAKAERDALAKKEAEATASRLEAARRQKAEAEAALKARREVLFDAEADKVRARASDAWKETKPLLLGSSGRDVARAFLDAFGAATVSVTDDTGTYTEPVDIPEVVEARAWLSGQPSTRPSATVAGPPWKGLKVEITGIASFDAVFARAGGILETLQGVQTDMDTARAGLNEVLGLASSVPVGDAFRDLAGKAGGKVKVAMRGTVPRLEVAGAVPQNVRNGVDAANELLRVYAEADGRARGVQEEGRALVSDCQELPAKLVPEAKAAGVRVTTIPSLTKKVNNNLKVVQQIPTGAAELSAVAQDSVRDAVNAFK